MNASGGQATLNLQYELNGIHIEDIQEFRTNLEYIRKILAECNSPLSIFFKPKPMDAFEFIGDQILSNIVKPTIGLGCWSLEKMGKGKRNRLLRSHRRAVNRILKRKGLTMGKTATAHITSGENGMGVKVKLFTDHKDLYFHYDVFGSNLRNALGNAISWANVTKYSEIFIVKEAKDNKMQ